MLIAILNQSTLVTDADAAAMTQAVASQVRFDAARCGTGRPRRWCSTPTRPPSRRRRTA